jgi:hypothetical protein
MLEKYLVPVDGVCFAAECGEKGIVAEPGIFSGKIQRSAGELCAKDALHAVLDKRGFRDAWGIFERRFSGDTNTVISAGKQKGQYKPSYAAAFAYRHFIAFLLRMDGFRTAAWSRRHRVPIPAHSCQ